MRSVLTISLPEEEKKMIVHRAKKAGTSVSYYILYATQLEQTLIGEGEILKMARKAEKDYRTGKTKILRSLKDLMP